MSVAWEPDADLVTGDGVVLELPVARIPTRALSLAVDLAVMAALALLGAFAYAAVDPALSDSAQRALLIVGLVVVSVGYPVAMETLNRGRTLGRMAVGQRVVRDDGGAITFGQALVRAMAGSVDFVVTSGAGALISALLSDRDKRLGDRLAGTFVVRERAPRRSTPGTAVAASPAARGWAQRSDLVNLDDALAARVRIYLERRAAMSPQARARVGAQLAALVARRVDPAPPGMGPEDYLAAVLAGRRR